MPVEHDGSTTTVGFPEKPTAPVHRQITTVRYAARPRINLAKRYLTIFVYYDVDGYRAECATTGQHAEASTSAEAIEKLQKLIELYLRLHIDQQQSINQALGQPNWKTKLRYKLIKLKYQFRLALYPERVAQAPRMKTICASEFLKLENSFTISNDGTINKLSLFDVTSCGHTAY